MTTAAMVPALPPAAVPREALGLVVEAARRELTRMKGWQATGATLYDPDIRLLDQALTAAAVLALDEDGNAILPPPTAAALGFYAARECRLLAGMAAVWPTCADLADPAAELRAAILTIPYTLRKDG